MSILFKPATVEENAFLLASHLPHGKIWMNAFDPSDDFGKLFKGLAMEFYRFQVLEEKFYDEMDIDEANELLTDWEKSVGLPNSCFSTNVSKTERRKQIKQIFSKFGGVQKAEDFVRVAAVFDFDITVIPTRTIVELPLEFPMLFFGDKKDVVHSFFIQINSDLTTESTFSIPFPVPFSSGGKGFLQCIFDFLAPANVKVIIINKGDI